MENKPKEKLTGEFMSGSYVYKPEVKEGATVVKKAWCAFRIKTEGKEVLVTLYDATANRFDEKVNTKSIGKGVVLNFEGRMKEKEYKGSKRFEFSGYKFWDENKVNVSNKEKETSAKK